MILNVGCGGRPGDKMVDYGDVRIDIVDFPNLTHIMDAHRLPEDWAGRFDKVACYTALEHFDSPVMALREMARVLKPDGFIEIVVPNLHYWRRVFRNGRPKYDELRNSRNPPSHKSGWDLVEMRNLAVQCGLIITRHYFLDWLPERKRDPRPWWAKMLINFLPDYLRMTEVRFILMRGGP